MTKRKITMMKKMNIEDVIKSERERLKGDPNIIGLGYGAKTTKGKYVPGTCVIYIVKKKISKIEDVKKAKSRVVPDKIGGHPTDVIEERPNRPNDDGPPTGDRGARREDPLVGGTSTTVLSDWYSFPTGYGTLGGICFDADTGDAMAISNAHVWGMDTGKDVIQPWLPTTEYLEAVVELLACGPVISYILESAVPSPLTAGLAAAAGAAWIAAAASDVEDPSRWGQKATGTPPTASITEAEKVLLAAEIPCRPFAGMDYSTKTKWEYTRETTQGVFTKKISKTRKNEHVLAGKKVWTEREKYRGGERVFICAEVRTLEAQRAEDYFVVAHCFSQSNPERIIRRVLTPGYCPFAQREKETCFHGFPPPAEPGKEVQFPYDVDIFHFEAKGPGRFLGPWPYNDPNGVIVMRIPTGGLKITFPPSREVKIEVYHTNRPIRAEAFDMKGVSVGIAESSEQEGVLQTLVLTGTGIVSVVLSDGGGEGCLVGMCATHKESKERETGKERTFSYTGYIDLDLREPADKWGIALFVQTVNNVPLGTDPVQAAQTIGGITVSDNIEECEPCKIVMMVDCVFEVIS